MMTESMQFSVILPVCHGGRFLRNALASLHEMDFPKDRFEVLVAGPENDPETKQIVEDESARTEFALKHVSSNSGNRSSKLNAACAVAQGEFLAFADDDCVFLPDWLRKLQEVLQCEAEVGIVGGRDELSQEADGFSLALDWVLSSFIGSGGFRRRARLSVGKYYPRLWNMAIPREVASQVVLGKEDAMPQFFNESLTVHEDVDLVNRIERLGKRIVYAPHVRIRHFRDTTFQSLIRRNFDMARTCRSLGVHHFPHMVLATSLLGAMALLTLSVFFQPARVFLCIFIAMYTFLLFCSGLSAVKATKNLYTFPIVPLLLIGIHVARGLGYIWPWWPGRTRVEALP